MIVTSNDWIPRYDHYGVVGIIKETLSNNYEFNEFVKQVNSKMNKTQKGLFDLSNDMMNLLISDLYSSGKLTEIRFNGKAPEPVEISRSTEPKGLGQSDSSIHFDTPKVGQVEVMWYVNDVLTLTETRDLAANRSIEKSQLKTSKNDIVQIAYIDSSLLVSWWASIEIL